MIKTFVQVNPDLLNPLVSKSMILYDNTLRQSHHCHSCIIFFFVYISTSFIQNVQLPIPKAVC